MGQWTRMENSNEVFLRVTNHTGQAEKSLLGPAGIRTRDLRFTSTMLYRLIELQVRLEAGRQMMVLGLFRYFETESSFFHIKTTVYIH